MRLRTFCAWIIPGAFLVFWLAGCQSDGSGVFKERGVYTTIAPARSELDLPGSAYVQKNSFGADTIPAAVVLGFGGEGGQQQLLTLELIELSTGQVLLSKDMYASYGKAGVLPLAINKSGEYKVRVLINGSEFDSYRFTVTRGEENPTAGANQSSTLGYAKGIFAVQFEAEKDLDGFHAYDDALVHSLLRSAVKEARTAPFELFAQRRPGKVTFQGRQSSDGRISDLKILENTLGQAFGPLFESAVLNGGPYPPWPAAAQESLGADSRNFRVTFRYD